MSFDSSRFTFNPLNDYFGVVMEQGRVQLDSDWNEWLAELNRRIQAGTLDTLGRAVYPATTPYAFQITATGTTLMIGPGRMYVDGILVENHGDLTAAVWDPALAEMSDAPQPPLAAPTGGAAPAGSIAYLKQPHPPTPTLDTTHGPYLAYLDAWTRPVTYLEDPNLIDKAVGVDTAGRLQTAWQVKLLPVPAGTTCGSIPNWPPAPSAGLLSTTTTPNTPAGPCCVNDSTGYTGMENQFYRVEIHQAGTPALAATLPFAYPLTGMATFKWSRDNASVMTGVTAIAATSNSAGGPASKLTVLSLGRDQTLGFAPGNWIEILDDTLEFSGGPRELCLIDSVDLSSHTITLTAPLATPFPTDPTTTYTRIIRWDQAGKIYESDGTKLTNLWIDVGANNSTGDIPVPPPGTMLVLENGVTVFFDENPAGGGFLLADSWSFFARTADGSVETLVKVPPRSVHHHYAALSIVDFSIPGATDCRTEWPPTATAECGCCCTNTVGVGAKYTSIQAAINALPAAGGEICILPGIYYENIFLEGLSDVVLHGCGWQTRIVSSALNPANSSSSGGGAAGTGGTTTTTPPYTAVITVSDSQHIELRDFAVEAADQEVGILLDGSGKLGVTPPTAGAPAAPGTPAASPDGAPPATAVGAFFEENLVIDTAIENLVITASTMPAILAYEVRLLRIDDNRIAMQDVQSQWPAVWVLGSEVHIDRNWVGIQTPSSLIEWMPASVAGDLQAEQNLTAARSARRTLNRKAALKTGLTALQAETEFNTLGISNVGGIATHPGGIQIAGRSSSVYIIENEIIGGGRNGITLGSFTTLDGNNKVTGTPIGVVVNTPGPCASTVSLETGGTTTSAVSVNVISQGNLIDIQIDRNLIVNMGMCGIGPAGFFDISKTPEVVSVRNLNITSNTIKRTLRSTLAPSTLGSTKIGYGAICLPDVQNLIVRDNTITDFGDQPGAEVCGIYILHGEMIEINRNQITETRDWSESSTAEEQPNTARGGIFVALATPPSFPGTQTFSLWTASRGAASAPIYVPSLPSLRVEHNVVRVPLAYALYAFGYGPFSIVDNHLSCGGTVAGRRFESAQTVLIINMGLAIEIASFLGFLGLYNSATTTGVGSFQKQPNFPLGGTVMFTNNICQLERAAIEPQQPFALTSVAIISLDTILFSNNQCWADGLLAAFVDAFLLGVSVQVTGNRFQETLLPFAVLFSGVTIGLLNITSLNISTLCLLAYGGAVINTNNQCIVSLLAAQDPNGKDPCAAFQGQ